MNIGFIKGRPGLRIATLALSGAAIVAAVVTTTTHAQEKSGKASAAGVAQLSDAEVFVGVFYGSGNGASLKPVLPGVKQTKPLKGAATATDVVEALEAEYPGFLAEFRKAVTSGDHELVEAAVNETLARLTEISRPIDPAAKKSGGGGCFIICIHGKDESIYEQLANDELLRSEFVNAVAQGL